MKQFVLSSALKRDIKKAKLRGKNLLGFKEVIKLLMEGEPIPSFYRDHALSGKWTNYIDLHLEPDFFFIYKTTSTEVYGQRLGTHSDLFK